MQFGNVTLLDRYVKKKKNKKYCKTSMVSKLTEISIM